MAQIIPLLVFGESWGLVGEWAAHVTGGRMLCYESELEKGIFPLVEPKGLQCLLLCIVRSPVGVSVHGEFMLPRVQTAMSLVKQR